MDEVDLTVTNKAKEYLSRKLDDTKNKHQNKKEREK